MWVSTGFGVGKYDRVYFRGLVGGWVSSLQRVGCVSFLGRSGSGAMDERSESAAWWLARSGVVRLVAIRGLGCPRVSRPE